MRKATKKKGRKPSLIAIIILVILVVVILAIVLNKVKKDDKNKGITLDGTDQTIDGNTMTNEQKVEYDGNPYNVPQDYTKTIDYFVNEEGKSLEGEELSRVKDSIISKFKSISPDKLQLNVDMQNINLMFNQGTTTVAESTCLVFGVYERVDDNLKFISKYAMSIDTNTLYKYNSETLMYNMIEI